MNRITTLLSVSVLVLFSYSCSQKRYPDALTPEEALKSFDLNPDFNIEIFAAEPFIMDPVDLVFDEQGKIYVVEMPDYPYKPEPGKGKGKIKVLEDTDGDGRIDKATIFADSVTEATSMLPWKGGLLVTAAPNIWYMKDTNGDSKADVKEVLFTGFFENNSEAQITNLRFGVDNWIYASNHGQDGSVTFSKKPGGEPMNMKSADFRFRLDRNQFEQESGPGQFGHTFDDFGHRFVTENSLHMQQMIMPWRYLHRHEYLPSTRAVKDITDKEVIMFQTTPAPYWRAERTKRRNEQYQEQKLDRVEYAEDHFTGASGSTFYGGQTFPDKYYGNVFTGDVSGSLVHRDVLTALADSPTFRARRDSITEKDKEFLSSTDTWFRPAGFTVGPDGALYVIDFYRQHIETPVSIPDDLKADMDFMKGSDKGRIYRITPKNPKSTDKTVPNLAKMSAAELVSVLSHPGQWWRLQAQRLILEKQDKSIIPAVKTLFSESTDPRVRLHAFFVLEGLSALDAGLVAKAVDDKDAGVREYGLMFAEKYPQLLPAIVARTADSSARVAFQAALSVGNFPAKQSAPVLAKVVEQHYKDHWFRMAVLSSNAGTSPDLLKSLAAGNSFFSKSDAEKTDFIQDFAYVTGARNKDTEITALLSVVTKPGGSDTETWTSAVLSGIADGRNSRKEKTALGAESKKMLTAMKTTASAESKAVLEDILKP
ncbi:hypothetical protein DYBT9275_00391 [Dyadobacter sp. CECT 9275]|uniref:DUF7133 domain-containing protein n=1 Tax=Dyadobacter helix TaxID=2822344 RepID=A0A916JBI3_9BACT|nr:PVC-type heme-binding CxxCH protein [Dyadobacter sp. CECT 9275]CAG4989833.1 hypothetical protein DYBT9275_00391 [Dyadobacter sp. CECT 9275]